MQKLKHLLGYRVKECYKEVDSIIGAFARAEKDGGTPASICNKFEIKDHLCSENHVIDLNNVKMIDRETHNWKTRKRNRNISNANQNSSSYHLSHVWNKLLTDIRNHEQLLMKTSAQAEVNRSTSISNLVV